MGYWCWLSGVINSFTVVDDTSDPFVCRLWLIRFRQNQCECNVVDGFFTIWFSFSNVNLKSPNFFSPENLHFIVECIEAFDWLHLELELCFFLEQFHFYLIWEIEFYDQVFFLFDFGPVLCIEESPENGICSVFWADQRISIIGKIN